VIAGKAPEARGNLFKAQTWYAAALQGAVLVVAVALLSASSAHSTDTALRPYADGAPPTFTLDTLAGGRIDLAEYRGHVVLVHFFATWCEPCRAELASLQQLVLRMQGKHFSVVAVDVGEVDQRVRRFFETVRADFPILLDRDRTLAKAWHVYTLPTTLMLDAELKPRFIAEGDVDWSRPDVDDLLAKLVAEPATRKVGPDTPS
jgi:peroxiredoxin